MYEDSDTPWYGFYWINVWRGLSEKLNKGFMEKSKIFKQKYFNKGSGRQCHGGWTEYVVLWTNLLGFIWDI